MLWCYIWQEPLLTLPLCPTDCLLHCWFWLCGNFCSSFEEVLVETWQWIHECDSLCYSYYMVLSRNHWFILALVMWELLFLAPERFWLEHDNESMIVYHCVIATIWSFQEPLIHLGFGSVGTLVPSSREALVGTWQWTMSVIHCIIATMCSFQEPLIHYRIWLCGNLWS